MNGGNPPENRCAIILAGGEGKRLQPLIRRLRGDRLPKQYVNFTGVGSMLEQTFRRAELLIPRDRIFVVVGQGHLRFPEVVEQLSQRPQETVVVQPENKETAPGLLLPLLHVRHRYPESTVAVFPADHFIVEGDLFMRYVGDACRLVEEEPHRLVILGVEPDGPESEYGYILPNHEKIGSPSSRGMGVSRFIEKPNPPLAEQLILEGGLWNTMVFTLRAERLLLKIRAISPKLFDRFEPLADAIGTESYRKVLDEVYRNLDPVNFSSEILEALAQDKSSALGVLVARGITWNDWGTEARIQGSLQKQGVSSPWSIDSRYPVLN